MANAGMSCERCLERTNVWTMSMFNTQSICMSCLAREKSHPRYAKAREAEAKEVRLGNYNFPGVGLPNDLQGKRPSP